MLNSNLPDDAAPRSSRRSSKHESGKSKKPGKLERMGLGFLRKKDGNAMAQVKVGSIVETMVLSGRHRGIWVKCQVVGRSKDTMDIARLISANRCSRVEEVDSQVCIVTLHTAGDVLNGGDVKRDWNTKDWHDDGLVFFINVDLQFFHLSLLR